MTRRCSHCSNNGHNSRTCPTRSTCVGGVRLFGVRLTDGSIIKKSASMGNLSLQSTSSSAAASPGSDPVDDPDGYLSDDPAHATCSAHRRADRKKGVAWTEEEHRLFLLGLQKLGKGDWRGISRNYVPSRTPTQVASHAQKYFIRQCNATRRKRRSSLFDMVPEMQDEPTMPEDHFMLPPSQVLEHDDPTTFPSLKLSLNSEYEPMEATSDEKPEETNETTQAQSVETPAVVPAFFPAFLPVPFSLWPSNAASIKEEKEEENKLLWPSNAASIKEEKEEENKLLETSHHEVFRPIPVVPKEPVKVDELVGMSQLSIKENENRYIEPSSLTLNLLVGGSSRPSAFHANIPSNEADFSHEKGS